MCPNGQGPRHRRLLHGGRWSCRIPPSRLRVRFFSWYQNCQLATTHEGFVGGGECLSARFHFHVPCSPMDGTEPETPAVETDLSTPSLRPFTGAHSSSVVSLPAIQSKADRQDHSLFPETTPHIRRVQQDQERQDLEIRETAGRSMDQHSAIRG